MRKHSIALLVAALFWSSSSPADGSYFFTVNDLVPYMREFAKGQISEDFVLWKAASFVHYTLGVAESLEYAEQICFSAGTTKDQIASIVQKHLESNPARWADPAYVQTKTALMIAFQCKQ